jgi:exopolysaccharide production protein ExoZ
MIRNLQLLRAFAALSVVHLHAALQTPWAVGNFGVDLFFVLSGFIMSHICATGPDRFVARRLARILPLYWLATLAMFAWAVAAPNPERATNTEPMHLLQSLLFIPYLKSPGQIMPILDLGWTLNYEMAFYAIVAGALALGLRRHATAAAALVVVAGVAVLNAHGPASIPGIFFTNWIALEFSLGVAIYWLTRPAFAARVPPAAAIAALVLAVAVLIRAELGGAAAGRTEMRLLLLGLPSAVVLACAVLLERSHAVRSRLLLLLGDASYAIYLSHVFTIQILYKLVYPRLGFGLDAVSMPGILAAVLASAGVGIGVHLWVERPLLRRLMPRRDVVRPDAGAVPAPLRS